jgi:hypothetical protein
MPAASRKPTYQVHIIAVTDATTRLQHVTPDRVASITAAKRLVRNMFYRICTVGGLAYLDTSTDTPHWVVTVHED